MDKAFLNNKKISAYEISLDYELEKAIRKSSRNKQILCCDNDCKNPVLRYCHGDKKMAYFAHLVNAECDYGKFDKNDTEYLKELRRKLYDVFTKLGYKVETEYKILSHHYSPLFCSKEDSLFVIEIGDSKTTSGYLETIMNEYKSKQIPVKWLVVGEEQFIVQENGVSFLKRFLLNESNKNDYILIDDNDIIQYRLDKKIYQLKQFGNIYKEKSKLQELCIEDGELCIGGYNSRFLLWQKGKEEKITQELIKREELKKERGRQELLQKQAEEERLNKIKAQQNIPKINLETKDLNNTLSFRSVGKVYTCNECGKQGGDGEFYMTQGTTGTCWECHYGKEKYQEIKKQKGY